MDEKKPREAPAGEKRKEPVAPPAVEAAPKKNNTLLFIGVIFIAVVLQAVMLLFIVKAVVPASPVAASAESSTDSTGDKAGAAATVMGQTTAETPIEVVVNIAGTNGDRLVKAAVVLEYIDREAAKKGGKEKKEGGNTSPMGDAIAQRTPKYKSQLIDIISKLSLAEITAPQAKAKIRQDFLSLVNSSISRKIGEVRDVYFTQFIIQ